MLWHMPKSLAPFMETELKRMIGVLVISLLAFASSASAADRMQVVASFSILGDMVQQVTGELADVTTIVGPDADPPLSA